MHLDDHGIDTTPTYALDTDTCLVIVSQVVTTSMKTTDSYLPEKVEVEFHMSESYNRLQRADVNILEDFLPAHEKVTTF